MKAFVVSILMLLSVQAQAGRVACQKEINKSVKEINSKAGGPSGIVEKTEVSTDVFSFGRLLLSLDQKIRRDLTPTMENAINASLAQNKSVVAFIYLPEFENDHVSCDQRVNILVLDSATCDVQFEKYVDSCK